MIQYVQSPTFPCTLLYHKIRGTLSKFIFPMLIQLGQHIHISQPPHMGSVGKIGQLPFSHCSTSPLEGEEEAHTHKWYCIERRGVKRWMNRATQWPSLNHPEGLFRGSGLVILIPCVPPSLPPFLQYLCCYPFPSLIGIYLNHLLFWIYASP